MIRILQPLEMVKRGSVAADSLLGMALAISLCIHFTIAVCTPTLEDREQVSRPGLRIEVTSLGEELKPPDPDPEPPRLDEASDLTLSARWEEMATLLRALRDQQLLAESALAEDSTQSAVIPQAGPESSPPAPEAPPEAPPEIPLDAIPALSAAQTPALPKEHSQEEIDKLLRETEEEAAQSQELRRYNFLVREAVDRTFSAQHQALRLGDTPGGRPAFLLRFYVDLEGHIFGLSMRAVPGSPPVAEELVDAILQLSPLPAPPPGVTKVLEFRYSVHFL